MAEKFCRYCGKPLQNGARFCISCGRPVENQGYSQSSAGATQTVHKDPPVAQKTASGGGRKIVAVTAAIAAAALLIGAAAGVFVIHRRAGGSDDVDIGGSDAEISAEQVEYGSEREAEAEPPIDAEASEHADKDSFNEALFDDEGTVEPNTEEEALDADIETEPMAEAAATPEQEPYYTYYIEAEGQLSLKVGEDIPENTYSLHGNGGSGHLSVETGTGKVIREADVSNTAAFNDSDTKISVYDDDTIIVDASDIKPLTLTLFAPGYSTEDFPEIFTDNSGEDYNSTAKNGQIFPDSSERLLTAEEVRALDDDELRFAINEIYARHGYTFKDEELLAYYRSFDWYEPTISAQSFSTTVFNKTEKENITTMQNERNRRK